MNPFMIAAKGVGKVLFGTNTKTTESVIEGAKSGIDKMFYTDEEKADNKLAINSMKVDVTKMILSGDNDQRSIARRKIAQNFTNVYLTFLVGSGILSLFDQNEKAKILFNLAKEISPYVGGIVGFYFLYYGVQSGIKTYKEKDKE